MVAFCLPVNPSPADYQHLRETMVAQHLEARGIRDPRVLEAMRQVPRELFVPADRRDEAYLDCPLPIGEGQTISQPYIVALMTEALGLVGDERVLEIGAGCGYQSAILSRLAAGVCALELNPRLQEGAVATLATLGVKNVDLRCGNGLVAWPDGGTFDAILVACAPTEVPRVLVDQLTPGGRLVLPVGPTGGIQSLQRIHKHPGGTVTTENITAVRFVPMLA